MDEVGQRVDAFSHQEGYRALVMLNPSKQDKARRRFDAAHELGHLLMHHGFRSAVDRQLRDALVEWAGDSRLSNPWAADCYRRARQRAHDHPHAVRVLARAGVCVLWRCWQDGVAYDPDRHAGLQQLTPVPDPDGQAGGGSEAVAS